MSAAFSGVVTSLITPFATRLADGVPDARLDPFRFEALVRWQARAGVSAVAVAGWIGEGATLERAERIALVEIARAAKGPMSVLAHVGTSSTTKSAAFALDAAAAGADGLVLVLPPYSKPNVRGIRGHVEAVARAAELPVLVEIDEARTNLNLSIADMISLMAIDGVAGIIDHSANPLHVECMGAAGAGRTFLSAHEPTACASCLLGADGMFSAVANYAPGLVVDLWSACLRGDAEETRALQTRLMPLVRAVETGGVAALKHAVHDALGSEPTVRLPLHPLARGEVRQIDEAMRAVERAARPRPVLVAAPGAGR